MYFGIHPHEGKLISNTLKLALASELVCNEHQAEESFVHWALYAQ